jgi:hypothetical protein
VSPNFIADRHPLPPTEGIYVCHWGSLHTTDIGVSVVNLIWGAPTLRDAVILALLSTLSVALGLVVRYGGQALVAWVNGRNRVAEIEATGKADVARIRETGQVLRDLAELEPERLHLERVRPPPRDEIEPPAAS